MDYRKIWMRVPNNKLKKSYYTWTNERMNEELILICYEWNDNNNEWGYRMRRDFDTQHDEQEKFMLHKFELIRHMFDEDY